jgi:hypothetical protein
MTQAEVNPSISVAEGADSVTHPTIQRYFTTFNQADFSTTASLFASNGQLCPPFDSPIEGRDAIAVYLQKEAQGLTALPETSEQQILPSGDTSVQVTGQVQTALFKVNVSWQFCLNSQSEILTAKIKLLATLRELLHLKP